MLVIKFEEKWKEMVATFELEDNSWIVELHEKRMKWSPAHLRGNFFAGIRATSQCEAFHAHVAKYNNFKGASHIFDIEWLWQSADHFLTKEMFILFQSYVSRTIKLGVVDCKEMVMFSVYIVVKYCSGIPLPTNMGSLGVEKDKGVVGDTSGGATLDHVVAAIKHLGQQMENMDNDNKRRLDAMEKTNTTLLKAMCNLVKQDYNQSTKDVVEDVAMSGTQNTCLYDQTLHCENPNKSVSNPTVWCTRKEAYGKCKAKLKNIETIFIPGDDDDDFPKPLNTGMKAKFLGEENNTRYSSPKTMNLSGPNDVKTIDDSSPQQPFMSNYPETNKESSMAPRKLPFPYYNSISRTSKKPKIEKQPHTWNAPKFEYTKGTSLGNMNMNKASRIFQRPRTNSNMSWSFKPTIDMNLTFEETHVCAYVFNPNMDPSGNKILYGVGNNLGTRQNFHSWCPNKPIREEIILFMALKVAYNQLYRTRSVWLPPAFALDVIDGTAVETLVEHYGKDWMPSFSNLKLTHVMHIVLETVFQTQDLRKIRIMDLRMDANGGVICESVVWSGKNVAAVLDEKTVRMKVTMTLR
ncbi:Protein FAR1-RELATED SEQUENCE 7 [Glycine soja]